jgi:Ca2+-binding RTX toxin-like protein
MFTINLQDLRFLQSRSQFAWLPEEQGGLVPLGPTGLRDVQGVGNNTTNQISPNYWFGAADTLFPRLTFNRLLTPGKKNDVISAPFANSPRGPAERVTIGFTTTVNGQVVDALNPRIISNLVANSAGISNFKLQDNPTGRVSPISGAVNPLPYSNWMSQFGQFFDHGLDFVAKGDDGKASASLLPSDPLYAASTTKALTTSRSNTVAVAIGEGSTDSLLVALGLTPDNTKTVVRFDQTSGVINAANGNGGADPFYKFKGTLVLNNILINVQATDPLDLVNQINIWTPTTGVTASATPFPAVPGTAFDQQGNYNFVLTPARGESFNQTSPFIDLSQNYGSDNSRTVFLREYITEADWRTALNNQALEATVTDLTTGRLLNAGKTVNGEADAGMANWADVKANAAKVGIILHDLDIGAIPLVAFDANGKFILDANGMPQLVALNKVTGEKVYVKDTDLTRDAAIAAAIEGTTYTAADFVLATTRHAFLNDMGVRDFTFTPGTRDLADPAALNAHYVSGDGRLNENIGLTAVHEVFLTEHNRVLTELKAKYGFTGEQPQGGWTWTDPLTGETAKVTGEDLFQQAKLVLEMEYQHMVFAEFARKLSPNVTAFVPNQAIDARVSSEFANAVYRLGHSMLPEAVGMRKQTNATSIATTAIGSTVVRVTMAAHGLANGNNITLSSIDQTIGGIAASRLNGTFAISNVTTNSFDITLTGAGATSVASGLVGDLVTIDINKQLMDAFLSPTSYTPGSTSALLANGSSAQVGMRIDEKVTDALRNNLLGQALDLATFNIIRGRDAGIPTLNEMRRSIQTLAPIALQATLNPYTSWANFRDNVKGATVAEQNLTVKNFIMAYAADAILTQFDNDATKTPADWYAMRESTDPAQQQAFMTALSGAADRAMLNATFMGTNGNKDFERIDAWIGGLAEREVVGGMLGSTFDAIFSQQMVNLQNGDNFYYLGRVPATEFFNEMIDGALLAELVMRSTGATHLYNDIFSVADKYVEMGDVSQPAGVANLAALQASTTTQQVLNASGQTVTAAIGRAGYVGTNLATRIFYGNPGNYTDARGVLNPNGVGNASEMIGGTAADDRIQSLGGNDTVYGDGGNDTIDGGSGVDFLHGGDGNDNINGGADNDFIYGEAGNDTLRGGLGIDALFGGSGNDTMYGGAEADALTGGEGDDIMYGGDGVVTNGILDPEPAAAVALIDDVMIGGAGNDTMYGGGGWDNLSGESGHDILIPGAGGVAQGGRDLMNGGEGDDIYIVESIADFANQDIADNGLTQLQLVNKGPGFRQGNGIAVDEVRFTQTTAGDIVLAGTNNLGVASIFTGVERVVIGTGTGATANTSGTAAINVDATLANVGLNVGLEIIGNAGANNIIGTIFNDRIDGGLGLDTMEGAIGDDTYVLSQATDIVIEATGGGMDTVIVNGAFNYTLADEVENLTLQSTAAQGTGNALDNIIIGNASNNTLRGLDGNDTIDGAAGDDTIEGGAGFDTMTGGAGIDTFLFGAAIADIGNDALARDTITDFGATDIMNLLAIDANTGLAGDQDFAYLGNGAFTGAGQLRLENGVLYGNVDADTGADFQIALTGVTSLTNANFIGLTGAGGAGGAGAVTGLTLTGTAAANTLTGGNLDDLINGLGGGDTLNGNGGNDTINGGDGNDNINGGVGNDILNGDAGNDTINGGDGDDVITGGLGRDTMTGGAGVDRFVFNSITETGNTNNTRDVIQNFVSGQDILDLSGIDADVNTVANDSFVFIGNAAFTGAGQIRFANGVLQGNVGGSLAADFQIQISGPATLNGNTDFVL